MSTSKSESVGIGDGVKEALFLQGVLSSILQRGSPKAIEVREDKQEAIKLAKNPLMSATSRHIDVRHHFLRELVNHKRFTFGAWSPKNEMLTP